MTRKIKVALCWPAAENDIKRYYSYATSGNLEIVAPRSLRIADLLEVTRDADVLVGSFPCGIPQRVVDEARNAKMIQTIQTGMVDSERGGTDKGFRNEHAIGVLSLPDIRIY